LDHKSKVVVGASSSQQLLWERVTLAMKFNGSIPASISMMCTVIYQQESHRLVSLSVFNLADNCESLGEARKAALVDNQLRNVRQCSLIGK
jgi:hypothetical protein